MYSSWYKNDQDITEEDYAFLAQKLPLAGWTWFISMAVISFLLVGLAIYCPSFGIYIAIIGFPIAAIVFSIWLFVLLGL